jgi:hypothetical protein
MNRASAFRQRLIALLPLYVAAYLVLLCGISAVNSTLEDPKLTTLTSLLCTLGVAVSLLLRVAGVSPQMVSWMAVLAGVAVFLSRATLAEMLFGALTVHGLDPASSVSVGMVLEWVTVLFSFTMLTNQSVLFAVVPCMALLGLMSSENLNPEMVTYFLTFVLATVFLMGYDGYLDRRVAPNEEVQVRPAVQSLLAVSVAIVAGASLIGAIVSAPLKAASRSIFEAAATKLSESGASLVPPTLSSTAEVMSLGGLPPRLSQRVVMHVRAPRPLYWRTTTFDLYAGDEWRVGGLRFAPPGRPWPGEQWPRTPVRRTGNGRFELDEERLADEGMAARVKVTQVFHLDGLRTESLPAASMPATVVGDFEEVTANQHLDLTATGPDSVEDYGVVSYVSVATPRQLRTATMLPDSDRVWEVPRGRYVRVGLVGVPRRVALLVARITRGCPSLYDRAIAIQSYLRRTCTYTLDPPNLPYGTDSTDFFLFDSQAGYCQQFASAMAVMCRIAGIPARVVVGYAPGTWDPESQSFVVRELDSHAWVELKFPQYGWVPFDPTAGASASPFTAFSLKRMLARVMALASGGRFMPTFMVLILTITSLYALKTQLYDRVLSRLVRRLLLALVEARRRDSASILAREYWSLCKRLSAKTGEVRRPSQTPHEFLARVSAAIPPDVASDAEFVTNAFVDACYGGEPPTPELLDEVASRCEQAKSALRRLKRPNRPQQPDLTPRGGLA